MDWSTGGNRERPQQQRRERVSDHHDAKRGRAAGRYAPDEITDAVADCGQLRVCGADQVMPLARLPKARSTSR